MKSETSKKRLGSAVAPKRPASGIKQCKAQTKPQDNFSDEAQPRKKSVAVMKSESKSNELTKADSDECLNERAQDLGLQQAQILAYYRNRADAFDTDR